MGENECVCPPLALYAHMYLVCVCVGVYTCVCMCVCVCSSMCRGDFGKDSLSCLPVAAHRLRQHAN